MTYANDIEAEERIDPMTALRSPLDRSKLKGKRVHYRTRWDDTERAGTIGRIGASFVWIGAGCFHHDDLITLTEVAE